LTENNNLIENCEKYFDSVLANLEIYSVPGPNISGII